MDCAVSSVPPSMNLEMMISFKTAIDQQQQQQKQQQQQQ